jgi:hypothetical protein
MKKIKLLTVLIVSVFFISSCATILTGSHDKIYFYTKPEGAEIYINGNKEGIAPSDISVKRSLFKKEVVIKKENYENRTILLEKQFNYVALLDIFGLWPFGVDILTGSIYKYDKVYYEIELTPLKNKK